MLRPVKLVEQWRRIERELPHGWADARLLLTVDEWSDFERAAALLGPLAPGRSGRSLRFYAARRGTGPSPDAVRRALARLDAAGVQGTLELLATGEAALEPRVEERGGLAASWDAALATLPADWSDLYVEVELRSTDHLERAALLLAPVNPARFGGRPGFRFRVAREFGYGASAEMTRRCLERLDAERITGRIEILRALADTRPVATQGPVWYVGGKAV
jgi:hypothetical protein